MVEGESKSEEIDVAYKLETSFVQYVAKDNLGRELTSEELQEFSKVFDDSIYEHIYHCVHAAVDILEWKSNL